MRRLMIVAAFLLLALPLNVFAQTSPNIVEFYGSIQSANATAIVINGQIIDTRLAKINAPLTAGTEVDVKAEIEADGSLVAQEIDTVAPGTIPGIVEIDGVVTGFFNCGIVIGSEPIDVCSAQVGDAVLSGQPYRVFAIQTAPGKWTALTVEKSVVPPVSTPEVIPPVSTPEVQPPVSTPEVLAPVSTPEVQPPVSTPEVLTPVSTPEVQPPVATPEVSSDNDSEHFVVQGALQAVDSSTITINGQRLLIGSAKIEGALTPGAQVRVEATVQNGQVVVTEIEVLGSDDHDGSNSGSGSSGNSNSGSNSSGSNSGSGSNNSGSGNNGSGGGSSGGSGSSGHSGDDGGSSGGHGDS